MKRKLSLKKGMTLCLSAIISTTLLSSCNNSNSTTTKSNQSLESSMSKQKIESSSDDSIPFSVFDRPELYNMAIDTRDTLLEFTKKGKPSTQIVVPLTDEEAVILDQQVENTIDLFNDFIDAWDNNNSKKCDMLINDFVAGYREYEERLDIISFKGLYELLLGKVLPDGYNGVPIQRTEQEGDDYYLYVARRTENDNQITYLGQVVDNTLVQYSNFAFAQTPGVWASKLFPFYKNIPDELTHSYKYIYDSSDDNILGVYREDEMNELINYKLSEIKESAGMDPSETFILQDENGVWSYYDSNYVLIDTLNNKEYNDLRDILKVQTAILSGEGDVKELKSIQWKTVKEIYEQEKQKVKKMN